MPLSQCWHCGKSLVDAEVQQVNRWNARVFEDWDRWLSMVDRQFVNTGSFSQERKDMLHQLCRLIVAENLAPKLQQYICDESKQPFIELVKMRKAFEQRGIEERHYVIGLAWWMMQMWPKRITLAIDARVLKTNELYRDNNSLKCYLGL